MNKTMLKKIYTHFYNRAKTIRQNCFWKKKGAKSKIFAPLRIIGKHFIEIGSNVIIMHHARIEAVYAYADEHFSPILQIGDYTTIQQRVHITCAEKVVIGSHVAILPDVLITDINHPYTELNTPPSECRLEHKPVFIGDETIVGMGARILPGVNIGKHCCIGTNAVVTKNIPDYSVAVGNPAKIIKQYDFGEKRWRKTDETIQLCSRGGGTNLVLLSKKLCIPLMYKRCA